LARFDAVVIAGTTKDLPPPVYDTDSCRDDLRNLERPAESVTESFRWQPLSTASGDSDASSFVFSAHLDTRWSPTPLIRIVGISSEVLQLAGGGTALFCRMWFADSSKPAFSRAAVEPLGESHGRRFVYFRC